MAALRPLLLWLMLTFGLADAAPAQVAASDASRYSAAVATEWFRLVLPAIQQTPG